MVKKSITCLIMAVVLHSCASQMAPSGGEKDVIPPAVVRTTPANLSTHFAAEKINITFDEFIQLGDFNSQVFFSPALNQRPHFKVHGKTLTITLQDTLLPKTTYTVNFGNAVKDITEGNIMVNYQYVFSTGDYIDSMRIQGLVRGAADGQPKDQVLAMLYSDLSDSAVINKRPSYYAHSDKSGQFSISHVKEGNYKLIALHDKNADLKFSPGDDIAFMDTAINIVDSTGFYTLTLFSPVVEQQKVLSASSSQPGRITVALARPAESLTLTQLNGLAPEGILQFSLARDTAFYYLNDVSSDTIRLQVREGDFTDTVEVRMKVVNEKDKVMLPRFAAGSPLKKGRNSLQQEPDKPFVLEFSTPVTGFSDSSRFLLINDSTGSSQRIGARLLTDTTTLKQRAELLVTLEEAAAYTLLVRDSVFKDVYGRYNDSVRFSFTTFEKSETGNLFIRLTTDTARNYFFELKSSSGDVIARGTLKKGLNELKYLNLRPGNYSLKVVEDLNNNRRWDTGNYLEHRQPEKIYNYAGDIVLRANWDLDVEMTVGGGRKTAERN